MTKGTSLSKRQLLLRIGTGLALLALSATAVNVIAFPYARACFHYRFPVQMPIFVLAAVFFLLIGRFLSIVKNRELERASKIVRPVVTLFILAIHLILGYWMEYSPQGDNRMIYDGAKMLATTGSFSEYKFTIYFAHFHNQWGPLLLLTAFFKFLYALGIENTFYSLVIVQSLLYAAAIPLLLSISRKLYGSRTELMTALMLVLCFPLYLASSVLYTDTFSLPFVVFTLYFALKVTEQKKLSGTILSALLCGLSAAFGCQIKMTVAIVLIAAFIIWLLTLRPLQTITASLITFTLILSTSAVTQHITTSQVLDPEMASKHNTPLVHWIMMSIPSEENPYGSYWSNLTIPAEENSPAGYTDDYSYTWDLIEKGASHEDVMNSIFSRMKERILPLKNPSVLFTAMMRKNAYSLGDGTFGMNEMLDDDPVRENLISSFVLEKRPYYFVYQTICAGIWAAHLLFAALCVFIDLKYKDMRSVFLHILIFGVLLFLLIWESRSRYIFNYTPIILILSASFCCRFHRFSPFKYISSKKHENKIHSIMK